MGISIDGDLSHVFELLDLAILQKIFYLLSINLLAIATYSFLHDKRKKNKSLHHLLDAERTVDLALHPEEEGEKIGRLLLTIRKGGRRMKDYLKSMSLTQWISIAIMIVAVIAGILVAVIPGWAQYEEIVYTIGATFGGSAFVGAFARGKSLATVGFNSEISNHKVKLKLYKKKLEELTTKYADVIEVHDEIQNFGGAMTAEQTTRYTTYSTQKRKLEELIAIEEKAIEEEKNAKKSAK